MRIEARDAVRDLILNQKVTLTYGSVERDGYGRLIASVQYEDQDVARHLLQNGLAHAFFIPPEELDTETLLAAQTSAQEEKIGIWSIPRYKSSLHMTSFHANAPGNDNDNINGEYIRVTNTTKSVLNMKDLKIQNLKGYTFDFADLEVPPGHTVKIHSGRGYNQRNPEKQLEMYLGSTRPIWDNEKDLATIYDGNGNVHDQRKHEPKTKPKNKPSLFHRCLMDISQHFTLEPKLTQEQIAFFERFGFLHFTNVASDAEVDAIVSEMNKMEQQFIEEDRKRPFWVYQFNGE